MESSEIEMLKASLQKVIDEMDGLEADRVLPDGHPNKMVAGAPEAPAPAIAADEPVDDGDMDPAVLSELMNKATTTDSSGVLPEEQESDLPPEIMEAVARSKKKPL